MRQGLTAAHRRGLIHRDIKPANLWLEEPSGRLKILDFGLAQQRSETNCESGEISGTPGFVSPEQARGFAVDARSDLFSLGCVLYLIASGKAAFGGPTSLQVLWTAIAERPPRRLTNPALPKELSELIDELVALKREVAQPPPMSSLRDCKQLSEHQSSEENGRFAGAVSCC